MRKGQEELVGFIAIVVLVSIVIVIALGFSLRSGNTEPKNSIDASQFLASAMESTSDCSLESEKVRVSELIELCKEGKQCKSGDSCDSLNTTLVEWINQAFPAGNDRPIKGHMLSIIYEINGSQNINLVSYTKSNCTSDIRGATNVLPSSPGRIKTTLGLCY